MKEFPSDLIVRYLSNEATAQEQEQLQHWIHQNDSNQILFHEFKDAWECQQQHQEGFNAHLALNKLNTAIDAHELHKTKKIRFSVFKIAASLLLLMTVGVTVWKLNKSNDLTNIVFSTTNNVDTVSLSDGSIVILNTNSSIEYPETFSSSTREVRMKGEAFFDIKPDPSRPFVVSTPDFKTQVLGTSFNINAGNVESRVTVKSGRVKVMTKTKEQILDPSDQVTISKTSLQLSRVNVDLTIGWIDNSFIFEDTPLNKAIMSVAERFRLEMNSQVNLNGCVITAKFKRATAEQILEAFAHSTGIQYKIQDHKMTIQEKSCE